MFLKVLTNITRDPGKTVKFICQVHNLDQNNSKVNFSWKINEVPLTLDDSRIKVKNFKVKGCVIFYCILGYDEN